MVTGTRVCVLKQLRDEEQDIWAERSEAASSGVARSQVKDLLTVDWKILIYRGEVTDL